jgi:NADP-dependent 3-hydroxy acid dehydrogenase YdfG
MKGIEATGEKVLAIWADSADVKAAKHTVTKTANTLGDNILVNNAGVAIVAPMHKQAANWVEINVLTLAKGIFGSTAKPTVSQ